MVRPITPYSTDLGDRDPVAAIRDTVSRIETLTKDWSVEQFNRSYAPGKWTVQQVLTHLAQSEIAFGYRARMALATPGYAAQGFNQDDWMARESRQPGAEALAAFLALARMNQRLFESLSVGERLTSLTHPEYGALTVDWIIHQTAGHQMHHLKQLEQVCNQDR